MFCAPKKSRDFSDFFEHRRKISAEILWTIGRVSSMYEKHKFSSIGRIPEP